MEDSKKKAIMKKIKRLYYNKIVSFALTNLFGSKNKNFQPQFVNGLDYEIIRAGAFYHNEELKTKPLVSIIVRTHKRDYALRENLISLRNQTYKNIEIVVVEDGENTSEKMIKEEFKDLNIVYKATGKNVGRSQVGNIGMDLAKGKYLNFLDDDDVFYPDHVETLVTVLENNKYDIVYSTSFETRMEVISTKPYKYDIKAKGLFDFGNLSKFELYKKNLYPIQAVMFKKELVKECGGLDTNIDALEDWDFWVRLSLKHNFNYVEKTTSIFRTPYKVENIQKRMEFLESALSYLEVKFKTYKPEFTAFDYYKE